MARETLIGRIFVELADTLVEGYDVIDFLHTLTGRCVELFDAAEAGVMLGAADGTLRVLASSSERMRLIELFEVQSDDGPCRDAWRTSDRVEEHDLATATRWPQFTPVAIAAGFRSVYAFPMRLRRTCIGALNLFAGRAGAFAEDEMGLAQAMTDVACIGILHERLAREKSVLNDQLQTALNSRVTLEQAKGMISAQAQVDVDAAFALLRGYTRRNNRLLSEVATDVVQRQLHADALRTQSPSEFR
jgi:hypothetical protein